MSVLDTAITGSRGGDHPTHDVSAVGLRSLWKTYALYSSPEFGCPPGTPG